jgi:DNA-nicking Smr family endonuclease
MAAGMASANKSWCHRTGDQTEEAEDGLQWSHLDALPDSPSDDVDASEDNKKSFEQKASAGNPIDCNDPYSYNLSGEIVQWDGEADMGVPEYGDNFDYSLEAVEDMEYDAMCCDDLDLATLAMTVEDLLATSSPGILFSSEAIFSALYEPECGWDPQIAATSLETSLRNTSECKPCRHLLNGGCYKKGCTFSHDFENITCKYWLLERGCTSFSIADGGTCPFQHRVVIVAPSSISNGYDGVSRDLGTTATTYNAPALASEEFPSLSSTSSRAKAIPQSGKKASDINIYSQGEYASALKHVAGNGSRGGSGYNALPTGPVAGWSAHFSTNIETASPTATGASTSQSYKNGASRTAWGGGGATNSSGKSKLLPSEWVDSGKTVATDYAALREEARSLAIARNTLLEQATQAYLGGARDVAKNLSAEGRAMNERMKQCHVEAAQEIFSRRNTTASIMNHSVGRVDLHGLHVAEAVECLRQLLPAISAGGQKRITIVTGSGHHTKGPQPGRARLLPAVQSFLDEMRVSYREVKDDNGYVGGLAVSLI